MNVRVSCDSLWFVLALLVAMASGAACERRRTPIDTIVQQQFDPLPSLREAEEAYRKQTNFAALPASDHVLGADPITIAPIGDGQRYVSLLRGRDALVVLDSALQELQRVPAPRSPSGLAVSSDGKTVFVVGEREGSVARYVVTESDPHLVAAGRFDLPDVRTLRGIAVGPEGVLYVVEEDRGRLISLVPQQVDTPKPDAILPARRTDIALGGNPMQIARVGKFVIANCVLAHSLVIRTVGSDGTIQDTPETRITHDGPIWSFSAVPWHDGLLVLAGGVEDHPLDRTGGFFGYIDSFVFLYHVQNGEAARVALTNVSELGVVTPKALQLDVRTDGKMDALVTGYGSEKLAKFVFIDGDKPSVETKTHKVPAGSRAFVKKSSGGYVVANPLLDAFVTLQDDGAMDAIVPVADVEVDPAYRDPPRLGEALFFTTLMAPFNKSDGPHSRFTCETCHFEGYVDGRIHHTGRGDVRVVSKPLLGLFNNRPHFSRALDKDLSSVAHNEFRVAGAGNDVSPLFDLEVKSSPTLQAVYKFSNESISALNLRMSLMYFLGAFSPRTNPAIEGRTKYSLLEAEGAAVFRDKCESCHQARTSTDEALTRASFGAWEEFVFSSNGPLVWALNEYRQTGVLPYVHERGARVPSLRRLYKKRPYLTNGSAKNLRSVLEWVGIADGGEFFHDKAPEGAKRLEAKEMDALEAFLALL